MSKRPLDDDEPASPKRARRDGDKVLATFSMNPTAALEKADADALANQQQQQQNQMYLHQYQQQHLQQLHRAAIAAVVDASQTPTAATPTVVTSFSTRKDALLQSAVASFSLPTVKNNAIQVVLDDNLLAFTNNHTGQRNESQVWAGSFTYTPCACLFPPLVTNINKIVRVYVAAKYLSYDNVNVRRRALWGTEVYTDDSDVVASAITLHDPTNLGQPVSTTTSPLTLATTRPLYKPNQSADLLLVTLRILPKLDFYPSTTRHLLCSRVWTDHDGVSLRIESIERRSTKPAMTRHQRKQECEKYALARAHYFTQQQEVAIGNNPSIITIVFNQHCQPMIQYQPSLVEHNDPSTLTLNKLSTHNLYLESDSSRATVSRLPNGDIRIVIHDNNSKNNSKSIDDSPTATVLCTWDKLTWTNAGCILLKQTEKAETMNDHDNLFVPVQRLSWVKKNK